MRVSSRIQVVVLLVALSFSLPVLAGEGSSSQLETMKSSKRFGIGFAAGGPLAIMGIVADVNFTPNFSMGLGMGTGLDYSTLMVNARYFLLGEWVSPYIGLSFARWWTSGTLATSVSPSILSDQFLGTGYDYSKGFSVFLLSPSLGVQFMHPMGFAISAELQYLFRMMDLSNGLYAGLSVHWYF